MRRFAQDRAGEWRGGRRGALRRLFPLVALALLALAWAPAIVFGACLGAEAGAVQPPNATFLRSYRATLRAPGRLALSPADELYVADPRRGTVLVRDPAGRVTHVQERLGGVSSVAVDADGRVYLGDRTTGTVTAFSPEWVPLFELGVGDGEFAVPTDIALDPGSGDVYVSDLERNEVKVFSAHGTLLRSFGGEGSGDGQFLGPSGIFVDAAAGEVLVADQLNFRVQAFDLAGNFLYCIGTGSRGFFGGARLLDAPQGIWVDASARIYVADAFESRVLVLDRAGAVLTTIGGYGEGGGQLRLPQDLAIDSFGRLFVSSANNARLEVYGLDDFSDPERIAPASVAVTPGVLQRSGDPAAVVILVEVPGYRLADLVTETLVANGVAPLALDPVAGDANNNAVPDFRASFDRDALLATLPREGTAEVTVRASIGSLELEGSDLVQVVAGIDDGDGDDVPDADDRCPETPPGQEVDAEGCSLAQRCPCGGPSDAGQRWAGHGGYVRCVTHAARSQWQAGLITKHEYRQLRRSASRSECGKRERDAEPGRRGEHDDDAEHRHGDDA